MEKLSIDELLGDDVLTVYPDGMDVERLTHSYQSIRTNSDGSKVDFNLVSNLLNELRQSVDEVYFSQAGKKLETLRLSRMELQFVREIYWNDGRFLEALNVMGIPHEHKEKIYLPFVNEIHSTELEHSFQDGKVDIKCGPMHHYEIQLARGGIKMPFKPISLGGYLVSTPDEDSCTGHLMIGLRGGASASGTYLIFGGGLVVENGLEDTTKSIYEIFIESELIPETNVDNLDIESATLLSRTFDYSANRGPSYNFWLQTNLSRQELNQRWIKNTHEDKFEHKAMVFMPVTDDGINKFLEDNYRGIKYSIHGQNENRKLLTHQGALCLAAKSGMTLDRLKELYVKGVL